MINEIYIEHNPFKVETKITINGDSNNIPFFDGIYSQKMQLWIERLFSDLNNHFNGEREYRVTFKGVPSDILDMQEAVKNAENQFDLVIDLHCIATEDSKTKLDKIQQLMKKAQNNPLFAKRLQAEEVKRNFDEAFNKDFDVYVAATMSAGKISAPNIELIKVDLPAANEATTATIAQIKDSSKYDIGHFVGQRINKEDYIVDDLQDVNLETLKKWNLFPDTKIIELEGNIVGITKRDDVRLVITDTPGPNNSQDAEHARTTMQHIQDSVRNPLILYILNATQLGTNDDKKVLEEISRIMQEGGKQAKDRFIFVVNKMDAFDPEKGEDVKAALARVTAYLENNGIENPLIYPVSAHFTYLSRKKANDATPLTRAERGDLNKYEDLFLEEPSMNLVQYMPLTKSARDKLAARDDINETLKRSGVPAVEVMIDEYIDKYNMPQRVNRAYLALEKAIKLGSDEENMTISLEKSIEEIEKVNHQIALIQSNKQASSRAKNTIKQKINDKKSLYSQDILGEIDILSAQVRGVINEFQDDFVGEEFTVKQAERRLNSLTRDIQFESNKLINKLDAIVVKSQNFATEKLKELFDEYVAQLFEGINTDDIPLPTLTLLLSVVT